jgi:hypothetical protein
MTVVLRILKMENCNNIYADAVVGRGNTNKLRDRDIQTDRSTGLTAVVTMLNIMSHMCRVDVL